jgi:tetratricopeptide (TPR) repeat protein
MTLPRALVLVLFVSVGAYANSVGNGFALDDIGIIRENPSVTEPTLEGVLEAPYWPNAREGSGLYRPVVIGSYALQWWGFDGSSMGFHVVSVASHAAVSVLLMLVLAGFVPVVAALAGALLFAVHPVHVEAVANVVGQAELFAAAAVLLACWLYVAGDAWTGAMRGARLAAIAVLYALGLGSKEIAVTLPALLVALDLVRASPPGALRRLQRGLPVQIALAAVLVTYLVLRTHVLGTAAGEAPAPALRGLTTGERMLTALSVWPEYLRLLLFPLDLASDYAPALILPAEGWSVDVAAGAVVLASLLVSIWVLRHRAPLVALGIAWFCVTILPVSNLVIPAGVILAERTLYLPSAGLAIGVAGLVALWAEAAGPRARTAAVALGMAVGTGLTVRTVLRNPSWFDTFTVLDTLAVEHPESYLSFRSRAEGLARIGDVEGAGAAYETAVALAPDHYSLALAAAEFYGSRGRFARAEELLTRANRQAPDLPEAHLLLAEYLIRQGRGREGHRAALAGLASSGPDERLFALLSESYIAKGDLEAAVRARLAAVGQAPDSRRDWGRLAELYDAMGRPDDARVARARQAAAQR